MKVYIYNRNCVCAGQSVPVRIIEQYDGDPDEAGDWTMYDYATDAELEEVAMRILDGAKTAGAGNDWFLRRVARTMLEQIMPRAEAADIIYPPEDD